MHKEPGRALLGLLCWASALAAGHDARAQPLDRAGTPFTATVASSDTFALVLRADNGTLVKFPIEDPWIVPAGLVPGTRVTVRYEVIEGNRYRLVGVKIASSPMEHGSTTDPPTMAPALPAAQDAPRREPGTSPVLPAPATEKPAPPPDEGAGGGAAASAPPSSPAPAVGVSRPVAKPRATPSPLASPDAPPPGTREIVTLLTLLVGSSALIWLALASA